MQPTCFWVSEWAVFYVPANNTACFCTDRINLAITSLTVFSRQVGLTWTSMFDTTVQYYVKQQYQVAVAVAYRPTPPAAWLVCQLTDGNFNSVSKKLVVSWVWYDNVVMLWRLLYNIYVRQPLSNMYRTLCTRYYIIIQAQDLSVDNISLTYLGCLGNLHHYLIVFYLQQNSPDVKNTRIINKIITTIWLSTRMYQYSDINRPIIVIRVRPGRVRTGIPSILAKILLFLPHFVYRYCNCWIKHTSPRVLSVTDLVY